MHLHWEKCAHSAGDCHIRSLSWMGRVPEQIPQVRSHSVDGSELSNGHRSHGSGGGDGGDVDHVGLVSVVEGVFAHYKYWLFAIGKRSRK